MKEKVSAAPSHPGKGAQRSGFSGKLGYILAVAGSAVGLGNIWRFPYLAAKYGGGIFLLTYLVLMLTFGYALIVSETALGRMTKRSPVGAFGTFGNSIPFRFGGWINAVIPMLIVPYYSVIGGWVVKYLFEYLRGGTKTLAGDDYFTGFISNGIEAEIWFLLFSLLVVAVLLAAVTSAISLAESGVSTFEDQLGFSRHKSTLLMGAVIILFGSASALGFGVLDFVTLLGMSILDFFDFLTNSLMMPVAALSTCILITRVVGLKRIEQEVGQSSEFKRKKMYCFFMRYLAPVCIVIILISSIANVFGWITM